MNNDESKHSNLWYFDDVWICLKPENPEVALALRGEDAPELKLLLASMR